MNGITRSVLFTLTIAATGFAQQYQYGYDAGQPSAQYQYGPPQEYSQPAYSQQAYPQQGYPQQNQAAPAELDNLVAPIALYPDPLLAQVLAASTYPAELQQAASWMQQRRGWAPRQLLDAARQTGWDPSVQALLAFPDALNLLASNLQWTTELGNAFLANQADVMSAIQRMRFSARQSGRLVSTAQQTITQPAPGAIQIAPADPQVMYVPMYNPQSIWGQPAWGAYPTIGSGYDFGGLLFGAATFVGSLFTGLLTWGGWGWGLNWLAHGLFLNGLFFNHFGFGGGFSGGGYGGYTRGPVLWAHDPVHRLGVPYGHGPYAGIASARAPYVGPSRAAAGYGFRSAPYSAARGGFSQSFAAPGPARSYAPSAMGNGFLGGGRYAAPSVPSAPRALAQNFSAPRLVSPPASSAHFSAPHFSTPHQSTPHQSTPHFSAPKSSGGGHGSGGGHSGGHHR